MTNLSMRAFFLTTSLVSCFASMAHAQESAPPRPSEPQPTNPLPGTDAATTPASETQPTTHMNLSVPPPAPALQRKDYMHEGFYFRLNVGGGYGYTDLTSRGTSDNGDAFALGVDVMVGGSPAPGVVFGGAAITNTLIATPLLGQNRTHFQFITGPFFDVYLRNKQGFHFGAAAGFAGTTLSDLPASAGFGGGGALFMGYDFWVAPEWSGGFLVRGSGAYMGSEDVQTGSFGLLGAFSLVYN